jgi:hypothetical protein
MVAIFFYQMADLDHNLFLLTSGSHENREIRLFSRISQLSVFDSIILSKKCVFFWEKM